MSLTRNPGIRAAALVALIGFAGASSAQILWNNGPFVTHPGAGPGGTDVSRLQVNSLGMLTLGFGAQADPDINNWVADDFTVPSGWIWDVTGITAYAYETNAPTSGSITGLRVRIFNGPPNAGGSLVFGDTTTNYMTSSTFSNVYRDSETIPGSTARAIMATRGTFSVSLGPGTYWVAVQFIGDTNLFGPFAPPVTIIGQTTTGNGLQFVGGQTNTWIPLEDAGSPSGESWRQDLPFLIHGTAVPEPGALLALGAGLAALMARRRRK